MDNKLKLKRELLEYYILTILCQKETHGAQLYKEIKPRIDTNASTVYDILSALERSEMLVGRIEKLDGKKRRVYTVTPRGLAHQAAYAQVFDERLQLYREQCAKDRFWPGFATGIFFPVWFPFFLIAFLFVLAFSVAIIGIALAVPGAATVGFAYFGVKLFIAAFTTYMAKGIMAVVVVSLIALVLCILSIFWAWATIRFVKFAGRVSGKAFRGLFRLLSGKKKY